MPVVVFSRFDCRFLAVLFSMFAGAFLSSAFLFAQTDKEARSSTETLSPFAQSAAESITEEQLRGAIRFLADDLLEGRGPATRGDRLTQLYLATQFQSLGLNPAGENGNWTQAVPLVGVTTSCPDKITMQTKSGNLDFEFYSDYIASSGRPQATVTIQEAEIVFVGYGITAPEYDWNDFKDVDVKGKVLLMLNNDPSDDPNLFEGRKRLYYGRWDYKYASAAAHGAVGAIIIHTTPSAGYPFSVVQTSWTGEQFEPGGKSGPRIDMAAWLTEAAASELVSNSGYELNELLESAQSRDFQPVPLDAKMSIEMSCVVRKQDTANVLAMLKGSDPELSDEYVVYMAHHDHIGLAAERDEDGDNIYNGAIDNASGTATLLAIASAYATAEQRPRRSILFAAVGAEEQGLLGSEYFGQHPTVPAGKMAAVINMDGISFLGPTYDINVIGNGKSSLDQVLDKVAKAQGRFLTPDHFPDRGYYYRSDQFSLAKVGVPGVYLHAGVNVVGKPDGWGEQQLDKWTDNVYHQPSDEYSEQWDLTGAIQDAQLLLHVGWLVAEADEMPTWKPGDEFEAARKSALAETE